MPDDLPPDELDLDKALALLAQPNGDRPVGVDPDSGLPVLIRQGRYGAYVQLGQALAGEDKPRTQSLLASMDAGEIGLKDALALLSLPRTVGADDQGVPIVAHYGRYGGYIVRRTDRRSLERDRDVFDITLPQALELLAQPRRRTRRRAPAEPLRQLGDDPVSGKPIVLREGRWGPYVTDGATNATLRAGDRPDSITPERAQELLQLRRERGPVKRRRRASKPRTANKKTRAKKTTANKRTGAKKARTKKKTRAKKATAK